MKQRDLANCWQGVGIGNLKVGYAIRLTADLAIAASTSGLSHPSSQPTHNRRLSPITAICTLSDRQRNY